MPSLNRVYLVGNLTRDPEVRYINSGAAVAELRLAVNETYRNKQGEQKENTIYLDVEVWERQAENCAEYLSKGSPILVEGRLKLDEWETPEGDKRSRLRVRADRVQFLSSGSGGGGGRRSGGRDEAAASPPSPREESGAPAPAPEEGPAGDDDDLPF